ncbi:MAG: phosphotransferase [Pseudomonadota bacterium]
MIVEAESRLSALTHWFMNWAGPSATKPEALAGDASFRRYFRAEIDKTSVVLCDSPPQTEKNREFVDVAMHLTAAGLRVPEILHADLERGFFVLEDLGHTDLLKRLSRESVSAYYEQASRMLVDLAVARPSSHLSVPYDRAHLQRELGLFSEWFCRQMLGRDLSGVEQHMVASLYELLCARALAQTQVLVHRDFHSRNLMVLDDDRLAVIDFQDAVLGALTYDPVSLLRDCYVRWADGDVRTWLLEHRARLQAAQVCVPDEEAFLEDADLMGLQRHLKVLGIFARLYLRDNKSSYLNDLPRVVGYVRDVAKCQTCEVTIKEFAGWFDDELLPVIRTQPWWNPHLATAPR